jgi:pimeloyl-ACP methyl ester carboxylesterase
MEASALTSAIDKLVLYEPPFPVGNPGPIFGPHMPERLEDLLRRGERDALVELFLREVVGVSEVELQALRRSSTWRVRVQAAHTLPREVRMAETYHFDPSRLAKVRTPTLLLLGSESPRLMHDSTMAAHAALQNSRVELLPGQGHAAMTTAPEMFLAKVLAFLGEA